MLRSGFELAERILSFPAPVLVACTGHAVAMGLFLLLSADYRVGSAGRYRLTANEVAIGLTIPQAAVEICRQRLGPAHLNRAVIIAEVFAPHDAVEAGLARPRRRRCRTGPAARARPPGTGQLDMAAHARPSCGSETRR